MSVRFSGKASHAALAAAIAGALTLVGCNSNSGQSGMNGASGNGTTTANNPAVQSSDMSTVPGPAMARATMAFPTGNASSSDLMVEETGPAQVRVGRPYNYSITVTNLTNATLTNVVLRQRVPSDFNLSGQGVTPPSADNGDNHGDNHADHGDYRGMARIDIGDLPPKASRTVQLSGTPSHPGMLDTCLAATYNPPLLCTHIDVVAPQLMARAEGPTSADICQDIVYHYTVTNTGTGVARGVILEENLPEGLTTTDDQKTVMAKLGDINQGQTKDVTLHVKAAEAGTFDSQAIVRSDVGNVRPEALHTKVMAPKLAVTIAGPKDTYIGQDLAYHITVKNDGDAPAMDTTVRLHAADAAGLIFVGAAGPDGSAIPNDRAASGLGLGTIAPGQSETASITFRSSNGGSLELDATARARCGAPAQTQVMTHILTLPASAIVVTHDPDPVLVGTDVTYKIILQNKGSANDHNVVIKATLPDSEQFVRGSGDTQVSDDGQNITLGTVDTLAPKQVEHWTIEAKALRPDEAQFRASMTSQSVTTPAEKIEPTKLYGNMGDNQVHTGVAPEPAPVQSPAVPPPPSPAPAH